MDTVEEANQDEQDVEDLIESLCRTDDDTSSQSDRGGDASDASSSTGTSGDERDSTTPAPSNKTKRDDDGADEGGNEDVRSVYKHLELDWDLYRCKFGDTPYGVAVAHMFVKYAELVDRLVGTFHCRPPMTLAEGEEVERLARTFVLDILTPVLGRIFSTKLRKLLPHVLAAIKLQGAVKNGDTGTNEALQVMRRGGTAGQTGTRTPSALSCCAPARGRWSSRRGSHARMRSSMHGSTTAATTWRPRHPRSLTAASARQARQRHRTAR